MPESVLEFGLLDYLQVVRRRFLIIILVFLVIFIFNVLRVNMQQSLYKASSSVQWVERKTLGGMLTELVETSPGDPLLTQAKIINSRIVLGRVAVELGLVGKNASAEEINEKADELQGKVATSVTANTSIITITITDYRPQFTATLANKIAEVYIEENIKERNKQNRVVREFVEEQLKEINARLRNSEDALARFRETEVPSGVAVSLENRLAALEAKRQELSQKYTDKHPDIQNIDQETTLVKEQLKSVPQKELEYSRLSREVEINAKLYTDLKDKLESARIAEAEKVEDVRLVETAILPTTPFSPNRRGGYVLGAVFGLIFGMGTAIGLDQFDTSIANVEDVEKYLNLPSFGIIPYLKTSKDEKNNFFQRLLGVSGKDKTEVAHFREHLLINYSSTSSAFEAYRIVRTNIQNELFKDKLHGKVLLISSSLPEEGKSITTSNLAIAMAQGGLRTLLIDADMRRSTIHGMFGMESEPGLSNILTQTADYKSAIRKFTDILVGKIGFDKILNMPGLDNLDILCGGSSTTNPAELLLKKEMTELLQDSRTKYDIVLVDSPPVLAVADAAILGSKTDGVVLIYRVGKTARSVILRAKTQFTESGSRVLGVILNNVSAVSEMHYGHYYNYRYYSKYYVSEDKKKKPS